MARRWRSAGSSTPSGSTSASNRVRKATRAQAVVVRGSCVTCKRHAPMRPRNAMSFGSTRSAGLLATVVALQDHFKLADKSGVVRAATPDGSLADSPGQLRREIHHSISSLLNARRDRLTRLKWARVGSARHPEHFCNARVAYRPIQAESKRAAVTGPAGGCPRAPSSLPFASVSQVTTHRTSSPACARSRGRPATRHRS